MTVGKNTIESAALRGVIQDVEQLDIQIKELREMKSAVMARAKSEGFSAFGIRYVLKARAMKPHDRAESETIRDIYMHAMDMDDEPPIHRAIAALAVAGVGREQLIESFKALCPATGDVILRVGGQPIRIFRDSDGEPAVEPYVDAINRERPSQSTSMAGKSSRVVPDVDGDGAEEFGRAMYRENRPVTENPFPFGDPRRARCDEGYRKESGSDGMGPGD